MVLGAVLSYPPFGFAVLGLFACSMIASNRFIARFNCDLALQLHAGVLQLFEERDTRTKKTDQRRSVSAAAVDIIDDNGKVVAASGAGTIEVSGCMRTPA